MSYPLPTIQDVLDTLGSKPFAYVSSLDLRQGYMQTYLEDSAKDKTAFISKPGEKWNFRRLPFGLKTAPSGYQFLMAKVFDRSLGFDRIIPYLNDVLVWSSLFEEHLQHLKKIFDRLMETGLRLHPKKCSFAGSECTYLGIKLTREGAKIDESKFEVIKNYPRPTNVKEVRQWIGFVAFYRQFLKDFSKICAPLYRLLRKDVEFEWNEDCEKAFVEIRDAMLRAPIRKYPDMSKPYSNYIQTQVPLL